VAGGVRPQNACIPPPASKTRSSYQNIRRRTKEPQRKSFRTWRQRLVSRKGDDLYSKNHRCRRAQSSKTFTRTIFARPFGYLRREDGATDRLPNGATLTQRRHGAAPSDGSLRRQSTSFANPSGSRRPRIFAGTRGEYQFAQRKRWRIRRRMLAKAGLDRLGCRIASATHFLPMLHARGGQASHRSENAALRFDKDSEVLGTLGHAKLRTAIIARRTASRAARRLPGAYGRWGAHRAWRVRSRESLRPVRLMARNW